MNLDPKVIFPIIFLVYMIDMFIFTILKILYEEKQILGREIFMTIVGAILPICAQIGSVFYFFVVIKCLDSYTVMMSDDKRERLSSRFAMLRAICWVIPPMCLGFAFIPAIGLAYPEYQATYARIYLIGTGANMWLYGILTATSLRYLLLELISQSQIFSQSSDDFKVVIWRLSLAYYLLIYNCLTVGGSLIVFGTIDFLRTLSTYLFIFDGLFCPIGATVLILTVSKISYNPKSSFTSASIKDKLFTIPAKIISQSVRLTKTSITVAPSPVSPMISVRYGVHEMEQP